MWSVQCQRGSLGANSTFALELRKTTENLDRVGRSQDLQRANSGPALNQSESESESELLYVWRFTANQFVLAISPFRPTTTNFIF
jgi:hypothetical protein